MNSLLNPNHYEVLEISREASPEQIQRAYSHLLKTYAEDSLVTYSIFDDDESRKIREQIEDAYRVLSDREERERYDQTLNEDASYGPRSNRGIPPSSLVSSLSTSEVVCQLDGFMEIEDEEGVVYNGARIRRARISRGIEIADVAGVTKINPGYLVAIEEDRYSDLPALVYVRGFVDSIARCLGLDAGKVVSSYMKLYEANQREGT